MSTQIIIVYLKESVYKLETKLFLNLVQNNIEISYYDMILHELILLTSRHTISCVCVKV